MPSTSHAQLCLQDTLQIGADDEHAEVSVPRYRTQHDRANLIFTTEASKLVCEVCNALGWQRRLYVDGVLAAQLNGNSTLPDGTSVYTVDGGLQVGTAQPRL